MACLITHANLIRQKCYTSLLVDKSAYSYCFHWWSLNLLLLQTELLLMSYKICCNTGTTQHSSMTALRYCCKLTCLWSMVVTDMSMSWCMFRFLVLSISIISIDRVTQGHQQHPPPPRPTFMNPSLLLLFSSLLPPLKLMINDAFLPTA